MAPAFTYITSAAGIAPVAAASVRVAGNLNTNSGETLNRAVLQGVGVCLAAGFLVRNELELAP